ncbi:MAG: hypothetical protein CSA53_00675 [Gammaproteobacteria bacterium]|nr:MAG: hypothetical protein CSA53_00675 [Gammaproteobacteria bacterium]
MSKKYVLALFLVITSLMVAPAYGDAALAGLDLKNQRQASATVTTGAQPSKEQLAMAAKAGVKHVVNLRSRNEKPFDEEQVVTSLGMQYHSLPIAGVDDLTRANADKFKALLDGIGDEKVLAHCASGNRVGALRALSAFYHDGADTDTAIATGKAWGMTRLEPAVRKVMAAKP